MKREITDIWLRTLKAPEQGRLEVWDARATGLCLRITASNARTWTAYARTASGKQCRPKIGEWPAMSIAEARAARQIVTGIQRGGNQGDRTESRPAVAQGRSASVAEQMQRWRPRRTAHRARPR